MATTLGLPSTLSHYHILEKIGAGGMGVVYRAHDERLDRDVAIKVLPPGVVSDSAARRRFRREALAASRLNHPNIATIHDFDSDAGIDFLVMEYIPGLSLDTLICDKPLPQQEALSFAMQLAEGLCAAHDSGLLHCDLKPANVRVMADGRLKILDFGLAKLMRGSECSGATLTATSSVSGTLPYMAPEQLAGKKVDERTDVYAAGAVLYEMVCGQRVIPESPTAHMIDAIMREEPVRPSTLNPTTPPALESLILKALNKDPAKRPQTARELLEELRALTGEAPRSRPSAWSTGWRVMRRRIRSHARATLGSCMVLLAVVLAVLWFHGRTPALAFAPRDFILIGDFDNQTGETVFDKSLTTAFNTSIAQSTYANVYSRQRIAGAVKRMKLTGADRVDEALAQEIAERENLKIVILPSISGVGDTYRVSARIRDVASGKDIRTEIVKANGKDKVLDGIDALAAAVRKDLGESLQTISQRKPLSTVTTRSLEALRQYSIAVEKLIAMQLQEARVYFENALRIDPSFTAARASLGILHLDQARMQGPQFDAEVGKKLLTEAVQHVDNLTDRERYGILAFYARAVENNPGKAIEYHKALLALYPDDPATHQNLGMAYVQMGRLPEALAEMKEATRVDPKLLISYAGIAGIYLYKMGNIAAAVPVCKHILEIDSSNAWAHDCLGWSAIGRNDLALAQQEYQKAVEDNPRATLFWFRLAHVHRLQGHYDAALKILQDITKIDPSDDSTYYDMGVTYQQMGDTAKARSAFEQFRSLVVKHAKKPQDTATVLEVAAVDVRLGQRARAEALLRAALMKDPKAHFDAAAVLSLLGRKEDAVKHFELAINDGFTNYIWLKIHPDFEPLRGDPRFEEILKRLIKVV